MTREASTCRCYPPALPAAAAAALVVVAMEAVAAEEASRVRLALCLSLSLSVSLSLSLSVCLSVPLSVCLSLCLSACLSLSICMWLCTCVRRVQGCAWLSICLPACLPASLSALCLSVLSLSLASALCVCLCMWTGLSAQKSIRRSYTSPTPSPEWVNCIVDWVCISLSLARSARVSARARVCVCSPGSSLACLCANDHWAVLQMLSSQA
jgi:hypothetical protein